MVKDQEADGTALYDLLHGPPPRHPLRDEALLGAFEEALSRLMQQEDAPGKPWLRLGLSRQ